MIRIGLVFLSLVFVGQIGCQQNCELENYQLSDSFKREIDVSDYCGKIRSSLNGDSLAFKELLVPPTGSGLMIDHANIVSQLVLDLGKKRICSWIESDVFSQEELMTVFAFSTHKYVLYRDEAFFTDDGIFQCE